MGVNDLSWLLLKLTTQTANTAMEGLLSVNLLRSSSTSHISPFISSFRSRFLAPQNPFCLSFSHTNSSQIWNSNKPFFVSFSSSSASNLGGWDDLESSSEDGSPAGELERLRNFLISKGIDDRKHAYLFLAGFASALAISRVRFSSIAVFPASVLVFILGFSLGIVRGGGLGRNSGSLGLELQSGFTVNAEKLMNLRDFLSELDVKISELRIGIKGAIDSNSIEIGEIKRYLAIVQSVKSGIVSSKSALGTLVGEDERRSDSDAEAVSLENTRHSDGGRAGEQQVARSSNQKASRRKRDVGVIGFDIFQFLVGLFQETSVGLKSQKVKEALKQESKEQLNSVPENDHVVVNERNGSVLVSEKIKKEGSSPVSKDIFGDVSRSSSSQLPLDKQSVKGSPQQNTVRLYENGQVLSGPTMETSHTEGFDGSGHKMKKFKVLSERVKRNYPDMAPSSKMILDNKASAINGKQFHNHMLSFDNGLGTGINGLHFAGEHQNFQKQGLWNQCEAWTLNGELSDSAVLGRCQENGKLVVENETCSQVLKEEFAKTMKSEQKTILNDHRCVSDKQQDEIPSSSTVSDDEFKWHLKKANGLLRQAREYLMVKADDEMAEILLYKSSCLFSTALQMKPTNLQAVGQLGNTFLLHGELKLKKSRELRALLSRGDYSSNRKEPRAQPNRLTYRALDKDKITSTLVDVCEECEELLIEAGRKYRVALSIDGDDVRALYNWGLALTFRAQLIADVGSEAALDADKVYLAAIDKFDAMVSKSNAHAPEGLFRWGVALQLRSHLRPSGSTEKLKLLHQAKRLLEDALHVDSNNPQAREALSSCILEINDSELL